MTANAGYARAQYLESKNETHGDEAAKKWHKHANMSRTDWGNMSRRRFAKHFQVKMPREERFLASKQIENEGEK